MIKDKNRPQSEMTARPSKYPQGHFKDKSCKWCDNSFQPNGPSHYYCCQDCKSKVHSDKYYKRNYGVTLREMLAMMDEQDWKCAICKDFGFKMRDNHISGLNLDHCHSIGKVRGLLCHNCNRGLGFSKGPLLLYSPVSRGMLYLKVAKYIKYRYTLLLLPIAH